MNPLRADLVVVDEVSMVDVVLMSQLLELFQITRLSCSWAMSTNSLRLDQGRCWRTSLRQSGFLPCG